MSDLNITFGPQKGINVTFPYSVPLPAGGGGGGGGTVTSVNGNTPDGAGNVAITKADIGLALVDNTADASKPVSTAQAAADAAVAAAAATDATSKANAAQSAATSAAATALAAHVAAPDPHPQYDTAAESQARADAAQAAAIASANAHSDGVAAGKEPTLPTGADAALFRDVSGNWLLRSLAATKTWLALAMSDVSGLVAALAAKVATTRTIAAGTGLTGGGDLSADRTLAVSYGTTSGTACQGNDGRLSDSRTPTAHAASHASGGSDQITIAESQVTGLVSDLAAKVSSASPSLTGTVKIGAGGEWDIYNLDSGANYERAFGRWVGNAFQIGTEQGGTGVTRSLQFVVNGLALATFGGGNVSMTVFKSSSFSWISGSAQMLPENTFGGFRFVSLLSAGGLVLIGQPTNYGAGWQNLDDGGLYAVLGDLSGYAGIYGLSINCSGGGTFGADTTVTGNVVLKNATSGQISITAPTGALGTRVWTLPAVTDTFVGLAATQTLTNKRITRREVALADAATVTLNVDTTDVGILATLSQATLFAAPTGTPTGSQTYQIQVKSTTSRTVSFASAFTGSNSISLPTATTGGSKTDIWTFEYITSLTKWVLVGVISGAS